MTTTLDAIAALPVPQRRRDMARRLWTQVHAQVPGMPEPKVTRIRTGNAQLAWETEHWVIEAEILGGFWGYWLFWSRSDKGIDFEVDDHFSIEPLLRVCQRFVEATAREVR